MNPNDTPTPRTDAELNKTWKGIHAAYVPMGFARQLERELTEAKTEVARLRDAFSRLTDEIECTPKCVSHSGDHCNCGRLERAYEISDSIPQNPTKCKEEIEALQRR